MNGLLCAVRREHLLDARVVADGGHRRRQGVPPRHAPPRGQAYADTGSSRDGGYTFVEILVTVVLMGTVVLAILAAVLTSVIASRTVYDSAQLSTVLLNAVDRVSRAPQLCDYRPYVEAAALSQGWPPGSVTSQTDRLLRNDGAEDDWGDGCAGDVAAFNVVRVTITAATPDGGLQRRVTVVKSSVDES